ncbi:MAG: DUF885 family protein [Planctomycetes bacterium]|nr:DUF885 family protein [Planctomycetota bacterium]
MPHTAALLPSLLLVALPLIAQTSTPDLSALVTRYTADRDLLRRRYDTPRSERLRQAQQQLREQVLAELAGMDWSTLSRDARIDWLLLDNHLRHEQDLAARAAEREASIAELLAFAEPLLRLHADWRELATAEARTVAATLDRGVVAVKATTAAFVDRGGLQWQRENGELRPVPTAEALRFTQTLDRLRRALADWFTFHDGYDPTFSWWCARPWRDLEQALQGCHERVQAATQRAGDTTLIGNPIGEAALLQELAFEYVPYGPAELVAIAEREFAFCDAEMAKAAAELGCGDDWRAALEKVKNLYVEPGRQPTLIRELAHEAIAFLEQRELLTIPPRARDSWRMAMMSAAAQKVNPFFLGGEVIQVSFPTSAMAHEEKLQSLRSNNEHFCRATVHHELIPGHWLQQYMQARHRPHRQMFETPFWIEGWALYWEMRLYDLGFAHGPEDRVGMLYWRKHRCARIVFSLNFHLGRWSPRQCIDWLIERVGHEPAAAEGEVRRSIGGAYGPLYQAAYMLGGLQLRALHGELVDGGGWTERAFHDAVLQQNSIPIALLRSALARELPGKDAGRQWRFAEPATVR